MRRPGLGHAVFAVVLIIVGILGFARGDLVAMWQPVPKGVPAREYLALLCAAVSLGAGVGLLWQRTAAFAARSLLTLLVIWFVVFRVPGLFTSSLIGGTWSAGYALVVIAATLVVLASVATDWDRAHLGFITGEKGARVARVCYGLGLLPFGYAHFAAVKPTADLIPAWLPWHTGLAYLTGSAFIAASIAILSGKYARTAAALSTLQMGLFGVLVWVPRAMAGTLSPFQVAESWTTLVLVAAGWVVAESYRAKESGELVTSFAPAF